MTLNAVYGLTQALHWTTKWDYFINLSASDLPLLRTVRKNNASRDDTERFLVYMQSSHSCVQNVVSVPETGVLSWCQPCCVSPALPGGCPLQIQLSPLCVCVWGGGIIVLDGARLTIKGRNKNLSEGVPVRLQQVQTELTPPRTSFR